MKKLMWVIVCVATLVGCAHTAAESPLYPAKVSHLENTTWTGRDNTYNSLQFEGDRLTIVTDEASNQLKPETDTTALAKNEKKMTVYKNISISVSGDTYVVKGKDFQMTFKRVGKRIIQDEQGEEYEVSHDLS